MPAYTRELSIVYGSTTVGGSTDYLIHDKIKIDRRYGMTTVSFNVVIAGASSEANFASQISALETAFTKPRQRLRIVQGSSTLLDLNPSTTDSLNPSTGFNQAPTISKRGDDGDTGRSRIYDVSITTETPADLTNQSGRRDSMITVTYTPSRRRTVNISGEYSALTTNDAEAQYTAAVGAYATSVLTALTGTWELVSELYNYEDTNTTLQFNRVYEELAFNQSSTTLNDTTIVQLVLDIIRLRTGDGDAVFGNVTRLTQLQCAFDASIVTTADLKTAWDSKLRPYILSRAKSLGELASAAVVGEQVDFDEKESKLSGTITVSGPTSSNLLRATLQQTITDTAGLLFVPVWAEGRFTKHEFEGPGDKTRNTTTVQLQVGSGSGGGSGGFNFGIQGANTSSSSSDSTRDTVKADLSDVIAAGGAGWRPVSLTKSEAPLRVGIHPDTFEVNQLSETLIETWIIAPVGSGAGGGSGGGVSRASQGGSSIAGGGSSGNGNKLSTLSGPHYSSSQSNKGGTVGNFNFGIQ